MGYLKNYYIQPVYFFVEGNIIIIKLPTPELLCSHKYLTLSQRIIFIDVRYKILYMLMKMQMNNLPLNKSNRTQFYQLKGKIIKKI